MCLSSPSCLFNLDFESLNEMDRIPVYPVGTLQVHLELPLAQFQDFLIALMPPILCVIVLVLGVQE